MYTPSKELCEPFELSAQTIIGLVEIIKKRQSDGAGDTYTPIFRYKRLDNYERETKNVDDLLRENNSHDTRIISVEITTEHYSIADKFDLSKCGLHYNIKFSSMENNEHDLGLRFFTSISYGVKGLDEDSAQLLFSEIDSYILNTIVLHKQRRLVKLLKSILSLSSLISVLFSLCLLPIVSVFLTARHNYREDMLQSALSSDSITEKLDTLLIISQANSINPLNSPYRVVSLLLLLVIVPGVWLLTLSDTIKQKLRYYYPFVFNFGVSPEDYQTRLRGFKAILGGFGALIVGVLGNFVYSFLSS